MAIKPPIIPTPNATIPPPGSRSIPCLNCNGSGHQIRMSLDGTRYPVTCRGCNGSGSQRVR